MPKFKKDDKVKIINRKDVWNNKHGIIISDTEEDFISNDNIDLTDVTVRVIFDDNNKNKSIIQKFPRYCLELDSISDSLFEKLNINSEESFKEYFIGKPCKFLGLDYANMYSRHEQEDGVYDYNKEDLEEIEYYESLTKIPCTISDCNLNDSFDEFEDLEENFNSSYWNLEFDSGDFLSGILGENIEIKDIDLKKLSESLDNKKVDYDYIHDYVFGESINSEDIPSWFFIDKLACAENKKANDIIKDSKKFGYKLYRITAPFFDKLVVAAQKCSKDIIYSDYADCLQGDVEIKEEI